MNVADQNALQERSHNTHKANILEKQCDSAMKNSLVAVSSRNGLNCFVWFVVSEKQGK